jgi:hypothetical protein
MMPPDTGPGVVGGAVVGGVVGGVVVTSSASQPARQSPAIRTITKGINKNFFILVNFTSSVNSQ